MCSESLGIYRQIQHDAGIAYALAGLAGVLAERSAGVSEEFESSHLATAAGVLAAAVALEGKSPYAPGRRGAAPLRANHGSPCVQRLSEEVFATAWARGQTMSLEQAVACVLPHT